MQDFYAYDYVRVWEGHTLEYEGYIAVIPESRLATIMVDRPYVGGASNIEEPARILPLDASHLRIEVVHRTPCNKEDVWAKDVRAGRRGVGGESFPVADAPNTAVVTWEALRALLDANEILVPRVK